MKTAVAGREERLYGISSIPMVIISVFIGGYYTFNRLPMLFAQGLGFDVVLWDIIPYVLVPGLIFGPLSFWVTYEILLRMEERVSPKAQLRRVAGHLFVQLTGVSIFVAVYLFSLIFLLPSTTSTIALAFTAIVWSLVFYVVLRRCRHVISKLEKSV